MLMPVALFLILLLAATWKGKGPVWVMALSWLLCISPISLGLVTYRYLLDENYRFSILLILFFLAFWAGAVLFRTGNTLTRAQYALPPVLIPAAFPVMECARVSGVAKVCWVVALVATALNFIDFLLLGGEGLNDLAALRETFVLKKSASIYAQLASLMIWTASFCFIYAIFFRKQLSQRSFLTMLIPILGFFSLSVLSAGRQAAFQIMLLSIITVLMTRHVMGRLEGADPSQQMIGRREKIAVASVAVAMLGYMGFIAVARNDGSVSDDKSVVLMVLFEFEFVPWLENLLTQWGAGLRGAVVEGMIYFSSPTALFDNFLAQDWRLYWGAISFPFLARQVDRITGGSSASALMEKADTLRDSGVIGVGWTTAISSYIMDFGTIGTMFFLFAWGYYSEKCWTRAIAFRNFYDVVLAIIVILSAVYMPLITIFSETNLLLLLIFAQIMSLRSSNQRMAFEQRLGGIHVPAAA